MINTGMSKHTEECSGCLAEYNGECAAKKSWIRKQKRKGKKKR